MKRNIKYVLGYKWVFVLFAVNFGVYYFLIADKSDFAGSFLLNFGAGLLQTIIIMILIERKLFEREEENRLKMQRHALARLTRGMYSQLNLLIKFTVVSSGRLIGELGDGYVSVAQLLNSGFCLESIETLAFCVNNGDKHIGIGYAQSINKRFKEDIVEVLSIYSSYLDSDLIDHINTILQNAFFNLFDDNLIDQELKENPNRQYKLLKGYMQSIQEYTDELLKLVEKYNEYCDIKKKIDINVTLDEWTSES